MQFLFHFLLITSWIITAKCPSIRHVLSDTSVFPARTCHIQKDQSMQPFLLPLSLSRFWEIASFHTKPCRPIRPGFMGSAFRRGDCQRYWPCFYNWTFLVDEASSLSADCGALSIGVAYYIYAIKRLRTLYCTKTLSHSFKLYNFPTWISTPGYVHE